MATVVDALVVTLNLDPTKYTEGQKKALAAFKQTKEQAKGTAEELEARGKQGASFFDGLRGGALKFLGVIGGVAGLTTFTTKMIQSEAATGRLARNLNTSTEKLTAWGTAVQQAGGSAEATNASISNIMQSLNKGILTGQSPLAVLFARLGIETIDRDTGKLKDAIRLFNELAVSLSKMTPMNATTIGNLFGLDQGTINFITQHKDDLKEVLAAAEASNSVTEKQAKNAEILTASWSKFLNTFIGQTRPAVDSVKSIFTDLFNFLTDQMEQRQGVIPVLEDLFKEKKGPTVSGKIRGPSNVGGGGADLLPLVRKLENSGDSAISPAGAVGRYQIMPATARLYGFDPARLKDPEYNTMVAKAILADLSQKYHGDTDQILANYNSGPRGTATFGRTGDASSLPRETQNYLAHAHRLESGAQGGGSNSTEIHIGQIIVQTQATDAQGIARDLGPAIKNYGIASQANSGLN